MARCGPRTSTTAIRRAAPSWLPSRPTGTATERRGMTDEELLRRYNPYLQYDSLESYRSDSAATMPEQFFSDGSKWSYANVLKRKGGRVVAPARPKRGEKPLTRECLGETK